MFLNERDITEVVATTTTENDPQDTADNVVANELLILHSRTGSYKWDKGSDDWHEACDGHGDATMFFEEFFGLCQLFLIDQSTKPGCFS